MKRKITFKLIVMLVTASILLSSTGLSAMLAEAQGVDETTTSAASDKFNAKPLAVSDADVKTEGGKLKKAGPTIAAEGGALRASTQSEVVVWQGVNEGAGELGSADNPYDVNDINHFLDIQNIANDTSNANKYFELTTDIDLKDLTITDFYNHRLLNSGFNASLICVNPVATSSNVFINLDGNGRIIHDLNISNASYDSCGIFGFLNQYSTLKNIIFENINQNVVCANASVDALVAVQNAGTIDNCTFNNMTLNMSNTNSSFGDSVTFGGRTVYVGFSAVVGDNQGTIRNCNFANVSISESQRNYIGVIAGQNRGTITGVNGSGLTITTDSSALSTFIGGITGKNQAGAVLSDCRIDLPGTNQVNSFSYGNKVGGISGSNAGTVSSCTVSGKVLNSGSREDGLNDRLDVNRYDMMGVNGFTDLAGDHPNIFGGISGENTGTISNCSAENVGMFSSQSSAYVIYGGIAGTTSNSITNSYASGKETGGNGKVNGYYVGGIAGSVIANTAFSNCYALVSLSQYATNGGALVGLGAVNATLSGCYWSSSVSGYSISYDKAMDNHDILRNITALCVAPNSSSVQINKSQFTHSWGGITGNDISIQYANSNSAFTLPDETNPKLFLQETADTISVIGGDTSGISRKINYTLKINLPAGIGAVPRAGELQQYMVVRQQLSIDAVVSSQANTENPIVSATNPIKITGISDISLLSTLRYSNFELTSDVTTPAGWSAPQFYGTLAGNGHTITLSTPLFSRIYGARDNSTPEGPNENLNTAIGYVHDFNMYLNAAISNGVMGTVIGATVKNIKLTGNASAVLNPAASNAGAFIDRLLGNSYVYGCFTDISVNINVNISSKIDNIAGFIGSIEADSATVDNCGSNSSVNCSVADKDHTAPIAVASFIGNIIKNSGTVKNCYCGGFVQRYGNIAIGSKANGITLQNIYWSTNNSDINQQTTTNPTAAPTTGTIQWNFVEGTGFVSSTGGYVNIMLPQNINLFTSSQTSDFSISFNNGSVSTDNNTWTIANGRLTVPIKRELSDIPAGTILTITHNQTGLKARIVITGGLAQDTTGAYLIGSATELQIFSQRQQFYLTDSSGNSISIKVRLTADIDMAGYSFTPIGTSLKPFIGTFDGKHNVDDKYTISNLSISGDNYVGMFGYVKSISSSVATTISNFNLNNINVNAVVPSNGKFVGAVVGCASGCSVSNISITSSGSTVSTINSSFNNINTNACIGGVIGGYAVVSGSPASAISNITINKLNVTSLGNAVGGIVGFIPAITVTIDGITAVDLNVTGKTSVGGVAGNIATGNVKISNVQISASGSNGTPTINGTGYVGGVVGYASASATIWTSIYNAVVNGITITNTYITDSASTGATGGIAGFFGGIIGDNPNTATIIETAKVLSCNISGSLTGGIVGKAYVDTLSGTNAICLSVSGCTVSGSTTINANTTADFVTTSAGGIVGICGDTDSSSTCTISSSFVQSGVSINGARYLGGVLALVNGSTYTTSPTTLTVSSCQSFASMTTTVSASYAGGIIGYQISQIDNSKIIGCVFGGRIISAKAAGGIVGSVAEQNPFSGSTPYISSSYVTSDRIMTSNNSQCGKIIGILEINTEFDFPRYVFTNDNIVQAINFVIFSSYPQNINAYGTGNDYGNINDYPNAKNTWHDICKPDDINYMSGISGPVSLYYHSPTDYKTEETINITNIPGPSNNFNGFVFDSGWTAVKDGKVIVQSLDTNNPPAYVNVKAQSSTLANNPSGIVSVYRNDNITLYDTDTPHTLSFKVCIPITCDGIVYNWSGSGTIDDPYQITDEFHLNEMRNTLTMVNGNYTFSGYFKLMNDITFNADEYNFDGSFYNNGKYFIPIKASNPANGSALPFTGHFDGNGKTISGLKINNTGATATYTGLFEQASGASFSNVTVQDAVINGDSVYSSNSGILVANAVNTVFSGVSVTNSILNNTANYAGGIVGYATGSTVTGSSVSACNITSSSSGSAGGIAGFFGGTIGSLAAGGFNVQVTNSNIQAGNAGGIVGYSFSNNLNINKALASGGTIKSSSTSNYNAAGGIIGITDGTSNTLTISYCKVAAGTVITGISGSNANIVGGIVGKIGSSVTSSPTVDINNTSSYAAVQAAGTAMGGSDAGGIVGHINNALKVKISNGIAGGSVSGLKYVGGIISCIEGSTLTYALSNATHNLVSNFVVSSDIAKNGTQTGLVLGFADNTLFPAVVSPATDYAVPTFSNIKYSSYQYIPGRLLIGNSVINNMTAPNFSATIYDLNKGFNDTWSDGYKGIRYNNGNDSDNISTTITLGKAGLVLDNSNMLLPIYSGTFGFKEGGSFESFTDTQDMNFTLNSVSTIDNSGVAIDLASYNFDTHTLLCGDEENSGIIIFQYSNGLKLALNIIAFQVAGNGAATGDGITTGPYQISNTKQLKLLSTFPTKHFVQIEDLDFNLNNDFSVGGLYYNSGSFWRPIPGNFTGTYDGQGHSITGLKINRPAESNVGFFSKIDSGARVSNLIFNNANVSGLNNVGTLAGSVTGYYSYTETVEGNTVTSYKAMVDEVTVQNSAVTSNAGGTSDSFSLAGGLVGFENNTSNGLSEANLLNCSVISTSVTTATLIYTAAGGITGGVQSIQGCTVDNISVNAGLIAGGIAGVINVGSAGTKVNIDSCVCNNALNSMGVSQINAKLSGDGSSFSSAGGIVGFTNVEAQAEINNCIVNAGTVVQCLNGTAGGIMGCINFSGIFSSGNNIVNRIYGSQSYAAVTGRSDVGGVLGALKGDSIILSNILFEGCVGSGTVKSTSTDATVDSDGSAGGIVGCVKGDSFTTTADFPPSFIKNCISSALLTVVSPFKGKLVGNCNSLYQFANPGDANYSNYISVYSNITDPTDRAAKFPIIFATLFSNNYISSYPQDCDAFGTDTDYGSKMNSLLKSSQNIFYTDVAKCKQTSGDPVNAMMVKNGSEYLPTAIAAYDSTHPNQTVTSNFEVKISVFDYAGNTPVDLVNMNSFSLFPGTDYQYSLNVPANQPVQVTTNADVSSSIVVNPDTSKTLSVNVTPHSKQAGNLEVNIGFGLKVSVPLLPFDIKGAGTYANPFQVANANHLNLMNYLPDAYYKQVADIAISPDDYKTVVSGGDTVVGVLYNEGSLFEGKGFRPIGFDGDKKTTGFQGQPFTGSYDGQNYKITGLYCNGYDMQYIGFFGYVNGTSKKIAELKNIHIELKENVYNTNVSDQNDKRFGICGAKYVGGLAGYCGPNVSISNCSVVSSAVAGSQMVGGLIGESHTSLSKCFTTCDVLAVGNGVSIPIYTGDAGGLIGFVNNDTNSKINISNCFATGSIYSGYLHAGGFAGRVSGSATINPALDITDSFFTGDVKSGNMATAAILIGTGTSTVGNINGNNIYVAGTNTSFNGAMVPVASQSGTKTNVYYDNTILSLSNSTQGTAMATADITNGTLPAGFASSVWTAVNGSYPRLTMADSYSNAFCSLATIPLQLNTKETVKDPTTNLITESPLDGLIYPVKIPDKVDGASIDLASSKLEYYSNSVAYPAGCDPTLTGNGTDMNTDFLFGSSVNNTKTIYRNIFTTDSFPTSSFQLLQVLHGELWYDCKTPIVTMTAVVNGVSVCRSFKLPLQTAVNTYFISTERQLRAIGNYNELISNTKYYNLAYATNAENKYGPNTKIILTTNINLRGDTLGAEFEPIPLLQGSFDGRGFTISKLKITQTGMNSTADNVGMFRSLAGKNSIATVKDTNLEDVWITGRDNVGAVAGSMNGASNISGCKVYSSGTQSINSFVTGNNNVGGLVGLAQGSSNTINNESSSAINVNGVNVVGGLAGTSSANIQNCFTSGKVTGTITTAGSSYGIGSFVGVVNGGTIIFDFSSGDVNVASVPDFVDSSKIIGIGGFVGTMTLSGAPSIASSFSSGEVKVNGIGKLKMTNATGDLTLGVGGLVGVNQSQVSSCYSSSPVKAQFTSNEVYGSTGTVGAGVGGVVGVGLNGVSDAYSSGSVSRTIPSTVSDDNSSTFFKSALGGVIGTVKVLNNAPSNFSQLYFDLWNSEYGSTLQTIGGCSDSVTVRSLTTDQMTPSQITSDSPLKLSDNTWSFNAGAYPCLQSLVGSNVSNYVKYAAVLSVVSAFLDGRDVSARSGSGITMAITTPNSITVAGTTYNLNWLEADNSAVKYMSSVSQDGKTSKFVPVRTSNAKQLLSLNVTADNINTPENESKYASRNFAKPCAQMCGTEVEPYLISTKTDFQHIGLSASDIADAKAAGFTNFYDTWFSPVNISLDGQCTNIGGKVYFRLLSDIDMTRDVNYIFEGGVLKDVDIKNPDSSTPDDDNHNIPYLLNQVYHFSGIPDDIYFQGISLDGREYTVKNFTAVSTATYTAKPLFDRISFRSDIKDIAFDNLKIDTGTSTNGTALVGQNSGKIDGCIINSGSIKAGSNAATITALNDDSDIRSDGSQQMGIITNCVVGAPLSNGNTTTVTGNSVIGGIAAVNGTRGTITNCAFADGSEVRADAAGSTANAGGIAGINNGIINNCFTMGKATATNGGTVVGGVVGSNSLSGTITGAYSRTAVSGTVSGSDNIGGFAGTNAGTISNAYSAGLVTLPATFTQTGIFCGTNNGTMTDVVADKAMSGKSTAQLLINSTLTDRLINMSCFSSSGSASTYFAQTNASSYPQLKDIQNLQAKFIDDYIKEQQRLHNDPTLVVDTSNLAIPQKIKLLMGYSVISSVTVNTKYSQYINTLPPSTANSLSSISISSSAATWLKNASWKKGNTVLTSAYNTGSTTGATTLTASLTIDLSTITTKTIVAALPIDIYVGDINVGVKNPNFNSGIGSSTNPYIIDSVGSFNSLAYYGPDSEICYKLMTDINYGGGCPALPITEFSGYLDGQNIASQSHVVYDVAINNNTGLFGIINKVAGSPTSGMVLNLGIVGAKVTDRSASDSVGLLAGRAQGATVTNCYAIGEINLAAKDVGGLIGLVAPNSTVTGCLTSGKFINTSTDPASTAGGIAGYADSTTASGINGCFSSAFVKGVSGKIGGIVGQMVNNANASGNVFAGMVLDSGLAGGSSAPAAGAAIGNIAGIKDSGSTITSSYYDKQISLIPDANATPKYTAELASAVSGAWAANANVGSYAVPSGFNNSSAKFAAGIAFATMPVKFLLGTAAGSTLNFSNVSMPGISNGDTVNATGNTDILKLTTGDGNPTMVSVKDYSAYINNKFTGVTVSLDTSRSDAKFYNQAQGKSMVNQIERYYEPRLDRIVQVSYTINDGTSSLANKTVAVQLKNMQSFAGEPLVYTSDAFTAVGSDPSVFEDLVVSFGGIYAGGELPAGYSYQITAKDQDNTDLTVTTGGKEYGAYIALLDTTTQIKLTYTIIRYTPWGVHKFWDSLVDTLVSG